MVSAFLIALIVPATVPLWQLVLAVSFGIVIGKEIFGGVGFNFLNPALTVRAFLFFAYPSEISGDKVWIAVDGYTKATPLSVAMQGGTKSLEESYHWWDAFWDLFRIDGRNFDVRLSFGCYFSHRNWDRVMADYGFSSYGNGGDSFSI